MSIASLYMIQKFILCDVTERLAESEWHDFYITIREEALRWFALYVFADIIWA